MKKRNAFAWFTLIGVSVLAPADRAYANDISGTITTTLTIVNKSKLVGDVTCQVNGAPCIVVQNPFAFFNVTATLDLNGFTITGQGDPQTAAGLLAE